MKKKRIAIIGAGAIGKKIAEELDKQLNEYYELIGIMKKTDDKVEVLTDRFNTKVTTNFSDLLKLKPDFIVEAASVDVVKKYAPTILSEGIHLIPLSVGALADSSFYQRLEQTARKNQAVLYIPSGAIGGFDYMRKMTLADSPTVEINTYKSPKSLADAPLIKNKDFPTNKKEIVFKGSAKDAITGFPQNINVAVATGLATIGPENVRTIIHSDPNLKANIHDVTIKNKEGTADIRFAAQPSENAQTSSITPWSVISLLKNIVEPVRFF